MHKSDALRRLQSPITTIRMDHAEVDQWIEQLGQCKQLTEADVKKLCEKVTLTLSTRQQRAKPHLHAPLVDSRDPYIRIQRSTSPLPRDRLR